MTLRQLVATINFWPLLYLPVSWNLEYLQEKALKKVLVKNRALPTNHQPYSLSFKYLNIVSNPKLNPNCGSEIVDPNHANAESQPSQCDLMLTPNRAFPVSEKLTGVNSQTVALVSTVLPVDKDTPKIYTFNIKISVSHRTYFYLKFIVVAAINW